MHILGFPNTHFKHARNCLIRPFLINHTQIQELHLARHCEGVKIPTLHRRMRAEELSQSSTGGSGAQFPTLIPWNYLLPLRKRTPLFVWFRSVFSPVFPCNQIARNSSPFLVFTKVFWCICIWYIYISIYGCTHTICHQTKLTYTYLQPHIYTQVCGQQRWKSSTWRTDSTFIVITIVYKTWMGKLDLIIWRLSKRLRCTLTLTSWPITRNGLMNKVIW